jgi:hypothetical protein
MTACGAYRCTIISNGCSLFRAAFTPAQLSPGREPAVARLGKSIIARASQVLGRPPLEDTMIDETSLNRTRKIRARARWDRPRKFQWRSVRPGLRVRVCGFLGLLLLLDCRSSAVSSVRHQPEGKGPWTARALRDDPDDFQFVVVTDRTGGARPGVFESAMDKTNLLRPELVMSVGDLIEGYTEDRALIDRQWDEFQAFVDRLDMRFYYVPGNHDMATAALAQAWQERFGPAYYSFVHRGVLFLCLNTEDGQKPGLGDEQVDALSLAIDQHPEVRWTLLFMHRPLWVAEEGDPQHLQFARIERKLEGRPYTVFAGHFHRYTRHVRNDRRYIVLATTGGGSRLRGPLFGEFDHVAWVTMTDQGPRVANLMLDGIADENVRTASQADIVQKVEDGWSLGIGGNLVQADRFAGGQLVLELVNHAPMAAEFQLELSGSERLRPQPPIVTMSIGAGETKRLPLELRVDKPRPLHDLPALTYEWTARFQVEGQPLELHEHATLPLYEPLALVQPPKPMTIDGRLDEWDNFRFEGKQAFHVPKNDPSWKGFEDLDYRFEVAEGPEHLLIAVHVIDDRVLAESNREPWGQDHIELLIDSREDPARANNRGEFEPGWRRYGWLSLSPADSRGAMAVEPHDRIPADVLIATHRTKSGYSAEVAIPHGVLDRMHGGSPWNAVRLNLIVQDADDKFGEDATLRWQPGWESKDNQPASGTFIRRAAAARGHSR